MEARRLADAAAFSACALPFLAAREAEHNLALGLLARLRAEPRLYGHEPWFAVAEEGERLVGCALRTPPHGVVLCRCEPAEAAAPLALAARDVFDALPSVVGSVDSAAAFAAAWEELTGAGARLGIRQRIHACSAVAGLPEAPGLARLAAPLERELVVSWIDAFLAEALPGAAQVESAADTYERRLSDPDGRWLVWDDGGGPVSLAGVGNATPTGIRVGPVYTPPGLRCRGYATSLVAALTRDELARGRSHCFLHTDLANPTSNAIYARIGYAPVADVDEWTFR